MISPLELIRTKMQSKTFSYKELYQIVSMKVSEDGWISLWKGWAPTILRDVPFSAMYWYNYENLRRWLCEKSDLYESTFMINFTAGALSGSFAAVATLPFDVVKTQKQTQLWTHEYCKFPEPLDMSTWSIMKNIVADRGFSGLFTGICLIKLSRLERCSAAKSIGCSSRGSRLISQHPPGNLDLSITPVPGNLAPSPRHTCTQCAQNIVK
ncbi:probable mitochondrial glutathione transporter SLC25A40 isoform X5 [Rattus norvegicus]